MLGQLIYPALATQPGKFSDWNNTAISGVFWRWCKPVSGGFLAFYKSFDCTGKVPHFADDHGGAGIAVWCRDINCGDVSVRVSFTNGSAVVEGSTLKSQYIPTGAMGVFLFEAWGKYDTHQLIEITAYQLSPKQLFPNPLFNFSY
jgi:hypothetical protein